LGLGALALAFLLPTLGVPVEKWHHHAHPGGHANCTLCHRATPPVADLTPPAALPETPVLAALRPPAAIRAPHAPSIGHEARAPPVRPSTPDGVANG
jgi:hypothetical protein